MRDASNYWAAQSESLGAVSGVRLVGDLFRSERGGKNCLLSKTLSDVIGQNTLYWPFWPI